MGSSPQARGTLQSCSTLTAQMRLIPAGAGNTTTRPRTRRSPRAHPRRRGEHKNRPKRNQLIAGSSPQARGTRGVRFLGFRRRRLIPAGAGNTGAGFVSRSWTWAHPRRRGEHVPCSSPNIASQGSSPQARGTPLKTKGTKGWMGLIPAGAGNTWCCRAYRRTARAHPRRRGEHKTLADQKIRLTGSSPQARGTRLGQSQRSPRRGLIPAGAGNTPTSFGTSPPTRAHPRRRGEHHVRAGLVDGGSGSSPQARGTPGPQSLAVGLTRLIPAGAGNTAYTYDV